MEKLTIKKWKYKGSEPEIEETLWYSENIMSNVNELESLIKSGEYYYILVIHKISHENYSGEFAIYYMIDSDGISKRGPYALPSGLLFYLDYYKDSTNVHST